MKRGLSLWNDDEGAILVEASAVVPLIFLMTFVTILYGLFVSQQSFLYYRTSVAAERAAFAWTNSAKDAKTGEYPSGSYDGLYWRLSNDALIGGLFGLGAEDGEVKVDVGAGAGEGEGEGEGSSAKDKLARAGRSLSDLHAAQARYRNVGIKQEVTVSAASSWLPGALVWLRGEERAATETSGLVVEPSEFLRSFDLVRYYAAKMKAFGDGESAYRERAAEALDGKGG